MKIRELIGFLGTGVVLSGLYYYLCLITGNAPLSPILQIRIGNQEFLVEGILLMVFFLIIGYFLVYFFRALFGRFRNNAVNNILLISTGLMAAWFAYLIYLGNTHEFINLTVGYPLPVEGSASTFSLGSDSQQAGFPLREVLYSKLAFFVLLLCVTIFRTGANDARAHR